LCRNDVGEQQVGVGERGGAVHQQRVAAAILGGDCEDGAAPPIRAQFREDVEIVEPGQRIVRNEHHHERSGGDDRLRPVPEPQRGIERRRDGTIRQFEQFQRGLAGEPLEHPATEIDDPFEIQRGEIGGDPVGLRHRAGDSGRDRLDPRIHRVHARKDRQRRQHHRTEARSHRERAVVGFLGQQDDMAARARALRQRAFGIAGDDEMMDRQARIGQLDRGDALGAVPRSTERHHQRRSLRVEIELRRADDIGGRDRLEELFDEKVGRLREMLDAETVRGRRRRDPVDAHQERDDLSGQPSWPGGGSSRQVVGSDGVCHKRRRRPEGRRVEFYAVVAGTGFEPVTFRL
jgi:hypothetical protein